MIDRLETPVGWLAKASAMLGGSVLIALVIITVVSVTGRSLIAIGLGPIPGDFELIEAGTALAVFAFLPWCQYNRGHARVEILAKRYGIFLNNIIDLISELAMLILWSYLIWRLWAGTLDKMSNGETTFILQFPIWWAYAACTCASAVILITATFCLARSARNLIQHRAPRLEGFHP